MSDRRCRYCQQVFHLSPYHLQGEEWCQEEWVRNRFPRGLAHSDEGVDTLNAVGRHRGDSLEPA